ncbi:MucR family transcriptional regulator [Rhodococcus marinonascens]|uniref:MucR family transcriptional regulator n=1 Tax=Rhodococcus marinonascens TaxID=38311 RepID=UPI000932567C
MHYKRIRAGRLVEESRQVGDADGFGNYGVIDETADGLLCHECGARARGLGVHVYKQHGMTAREYKVQHGFPVRKSLLPIDTQELLAAKARERVGTRGWQNLVDARNPIAAAAARTPSSFNRTGASALAAGAVAAMNGKRTRKGIVRTCPICGACWCPLPPAGYKRRTCSAECWSTLLSQKRRSR